MKLYSLITFFLCSALSSCTILGIATTGAQAAYDHHSLQKKFSDSWISMQAYNQLYRETNEFKDVDVSVAVFNHEVLLTGEVDTHLQKKKIEKIITNIEGVERVYNRITISPPSSTLVHISDSWITTKIKSKLIATLDIDPSQIKVVTESGTVYLMGIVPHDQADDATELARSTDGVQNVVKIFSYIKICRE